MNVRYRVELSQIERDELTALLGGGKHAARKIKRAQILLAADAGSSDEEIARTVSVSLSTVGRTKRRPEPASNGCSQPTKHAPNSAAPIQSPPKSQNHCDEPLV